MDTIMTTLSGMHVGTAVLGGFLLILSRNVLRGPRTANAEGNNEVRGCVASPATRQYGRVGRSCSGNVTQRIPMGANVHEPASHPQLNPPLLSACGQPSTLLVTPCRAGTCCSSLPAPTVPLCHLVWRESFVSVHHSVCWWALSSIHGSHTHAPPPLLASAHQPPLATRCLRWLPNTCLLALHCSLRTACSMITLSRAEQTKHSLHGVDV
jgi:hypothetical protein